MSLGKKLFVITAVLIGAAPLRGQEETVFDCFCSDGSPVSCVGGRPSFESEQGWQTVFQPLDPVETDYYRIVDLGVEFCAWYRNSGAFPLPIDILLDDESTGENDIKVRIELVVGTFSPGNVPTEEAFVQTIDLTESNVSEIAAEPGCFQFTTLIQSPIFLPETVVNVGFVWVYNQAYYDTVPDDFEGHYTEIRIAPRSPAPDEVAVCDLPALPPRAWYQNSIPSDGYLDEVWPFARVISIRAGIQRVDPVPTVSDWGIVAMALLTLTAGTLVYSRRRAQREPI